MGTRYPSICQFAMLSSLNWISLGLAGGIIVVIAIGITISGIAISLVYRQSGARVLRHLDESDVVATDDDATGSWACFIGSLKTPVWYCLNDSE